MFGNFHFIPFADLGWSYVHGLLQIGLEALIKPGNQRIPLIALQLLQILFILQTI